MGDIAVKCTWIAKRRPKFITTDHFPSYEEATVKCWVDIAEPGTADDNLQLTHSMTRKSDEEKCKPCNTAKLKTLI